MKKTFLLILALVLCLSICACGGKKNTETPENLGIQLTLDNYEQYLSVRAYASSGEKPQVGCRVEPTTSNYDYSDVKIVLRAYGKYTVINHTYLGFTTNGLASYKDYPHSKGNQEFDETFELRLNIGGSLIDDDGNSKKLYMPAGEACGPVNYIGTPKVENITCEYEVISIEGYVTKS